MKESCLGVGDWDGPCIVRWLTDEGLALFFYFFYFLVVWWSVARVVRRGGDGCRFRR